MTLKYWYIRRDIYEENPEDILNSYRSIADMVRLFRLPYWTMLGILLFASVLLFVFIMLPLQNLVIWIPIIIIVLINLLSQIPRERYLYKDPARSDEMAERMMSYEQYVLDVWVIFHKHGIDTLEKLSILKTECEAILKAHEDKYTKVNSRLVEMLIGVPLGALIASIIYTDSNTFPMAIIALVIIGFIVIGVVKLVKYINYYSEGYFKDKYLLDAINEVIYSEKYINNHKQH